MYPKCVSSVPSFVAPTKGMVMRSSELQPQKALPPMLVTPSGIVTEVKEVQPLKAYSPMLVTPFASHPVPDGDRRQSTAITEGIITYARHAVGDGD